MSDLDDRDATSNDEPPSADVRYSQGSVVGGHGHTIAQTFTTHHHSTTESAPGSTARRRLTRLADRLAGAVEVQWRTEAKDRGLVEPAPIEVGWLRKHGVAPPSSATAASTPFVPRLPGSGGGPPGEREQGTLSDLYSLYAGLRRLLVHGPAGAGKSAAAVMLVRAALEARSRVRDRADRSAVPVPVLLTPSSWYPGRSGTEWLVSLLHQTYRGLPTGRAGDALLTDLVTSDRIAVVLDGLDELPPAIRDDLVATLNREVTCRLVLLSRDDPTGRKAPMLDGATAIELQPVGAEAVADYLERVQVDTPPTRWRRLVDEVRADPEGPISRALQRPLPLTLLRDGYRGDDDALGTLLDACVVSDDAEASLQARLIDGFLPRVYREGGERDELGAARRTLRVIADLMDQDAHDGEGSGGTPTLAWWRIPQRTTTMLPQALVAGVVTGLAVTVGLALLVGLDSLADVALYARYGLVPATGAALGVWSVGRARSWSTAARWMSEADPPWLMVGLGLSTGFLAEFALVAATDVWTSVLVNAAALAVVLAVAVVARRRTRSSRRLVTRSIVLALVGFALGVAFLVAIPVEIRSKWFPIGASALAVVLGLVLALGRGSDAVVTPLAPFTSWRHRRSRTLLAWLAVAIPSALVFDIPQAAAPGVFGSTSAGTGFLFLDGLVLGLIWPETWTTSVACVQLAVRHGTPVRLMRFLDDAHARGVLRTSGPLYQFRHATLFATLAESDEPAERTETARAERLRSLLADDTVPIRDWWRLPAATPRWPRAIVVGLVAGLAGALGMALVIRALPSTTLFGIVVAPCALAAGAGSLVAQRRGAAVPWHAFPTPRWITRFALSLLAGLSVMGLNHLWGPETLGFTVVTGFAAGLVAWLLVWVMLRVTATASGRAARQRWRTIHLPPVVLGAALGTATLAQVMDLMDLETFVAAQPVLWASALTAGLLVLAAALHHGLRARHLGDGPHPLADLARWRRRTLPELAVWVLLTGLATGVLALDAFVVGRITVPLLADSPISPRGALNALIVTVTALTGFAAGLLCPATWTVALAGAQLAVTHRTPVRLLRAVEVARHRGEL